MLATAPATVATIVNTVGLAAFLVLSVWLAAVDWREHRLPNRLVAAAGICALTSHFAQTVVGAVSDPNLEPFIRSIVTAVACFALFLALHLASRTKNGTGMGAGDVKLAGVLGLYLGWISIDTAVLGIAAGFVLGAVFSLSMMAFRRANHRSRVAFGPWMLIGAWLAIVPATFG
jgi:leader peptidase (prepilin peptidase)/N-methyltransferase